MLQWTVHILI